jgi:hypothetical protein
MNKETKMHFLNDYEARYSLSVCKFCFQAYNPTIYFIATQLSFSFSQQMKNNNYFIMKFCFFKARPVVGKGGATQVPPFDDVETVAHYVPHSPTNHRRSPHNRQPIT